MTSALVAALGLAATVVLARLALAVHARQAVSERSRRLADGAWWCPPARPRADGRAGCGRRRPGRARRQQRQLVGELPEVLEDVARSLRSGTSLRLALTEASVGPPGGGARDDLAAVVERTERGMGLGASLDAWAAARPLAEVRVAVAALAFGLEAGAASARTVDGVAATLRERRAVGAEAGAQAAQARLSALVIALLPIAFTSWACLTDRRVASFLFTTPAGWACLMGGIALHGLGAVWMARIIRSAT